MSTKYKDPKEVPTTVLVARLKELADAVASGNFSELRMRIPAEVDRDADIVLTEVANRLINNSKTGWVLITLDAELEA